MKRLLLILALVLAPAALFAQVVDRDVLLTPDGTLYTIESKGRSARVIVRAIRHRAVAYRRRRS